MPKVGGKGVDKIWSDAVHRAVKRKQDGKADRNLERLADKLVAEGIAGNVQAIKEIGDRLDGKSVQGIANEGGEAFEITLIKRVIVDGNSSDPDS